MQADRDHTGNTLDTLFTPVSEYTYMIQFPISWMSGAVLSYIYQHTIRTVSFTILIHVIFI